MFKFCFSQVLKSTKQGISSYHVYFLFQNYHKNACQQLKNKKILGEKQILHIPIFTFLYFCTEELTLNVSTESKNNNH